MTQLTDAQRQQLLANGRKPDQDYAPVCRLFIENTNFICLLSEMDSDEDTVFGYFDHGMGFPELGYGSMSEMEDAAQSLGRELSSDPTFKGQWPMSVYTLYGRRADRIVYDL